jgi:hypothetical protein
MGFSKTAFSIKMNRALSSPISSMQRQRLAPTLTDHIGWVPWQVLFEHIHDTGDVLDRQELNETLLFADHTTITLKRLAKLSSAEDRKPFDSAISAIESLRKLLPKGDWF